MVYGRRGRDVGTPLLLLLVAPLLPPCTLALGSKHVVALRAASGKTSLGAGTREARAEDLISFPLTALPRQPRTEEGYKISPKPCEVSGIQGTCMFVWECLKTDGQHLGMCMDGFMFGSCCVHDTRDNDIFSYSTPSSSPSAYSSSSAFSSSSPYSSSFYPSSSPSYTSSIPVVPTSSPYTMKTSQPLKSSLGFTSLQEASQFRRPERPERPIKPSIERVGILSVDPKRPDRPTKTSTLIWPSPPPKNVYDTPPRPAGRPPNWDKKQDAYFPSSSSSGGGGDFEDLNTIATEESQDKWDWTSKERPTRPSRPPKTQGAASGLQQTTFTPPEDFISRQRMTSTTMATTTTTSTTTTSTTTSTTTTMTTTTTTTSTTTSTTTTEVPRRPAFHTVTAPSLSTSTALTPRPAAALAVSAENSPRSSCGQPTVMLHCSEGRIVNGSRACYGQFPWQVSVRRTSFLNIFGSSTHRCGGALLNEYWVSTAGHCVDDLTISQIRLRLGEWDFSSESEPNPHLELKATKKIVHPNYNFFTYENDLALVRTEKRVSFADNIIPICLPGNDDLLIGEFGTVAGWGRLSEKGILPSILQNVQVPIVSNEKCKSMFLAAGRHEVIPDIFMCAGYEDGSKDSCQGDSGGPLVVKGQDDRWFLAGIISWGIGCAEPNLPGVCTRISKFRSWILQNVT